MVKSSNESKVDKAKENKAFKKAKNKAENYVSNLKK